MVESLKKLIQVLISPSQAFEWVNEHPVWLVPLVILIATTILYAYVSAPFVADIAMQQLEKNSKDMPPEQIDQAKQMIGSPFMRTITLVFSLIGVIISVLVQAGLIHLAALALKGSAKFATGFAMIMYAQVPIIVQQLVQSLYSSASKTFVSPGLSAMLPIDQMNTPMGVLLSRIDIFSIWSLVLIAIGLVVVYKLPRLKAIGLTAGYWALSTIVGAIFAAIGSAGRIA